MKRGCFGNRISRFPITYYKSSKISFNTVTVFLIVFVLDEISVFRKLGGFYIFVLMSLRWNTFSVGHSYCQGFTPPLDLMFMTWLTFWYFLVSNLFKSLFFNLWKMFHLRSLYNILSEKMKAYNFSTVPFSV